MASSQGFEPPENYCITSPREDAVAQKALILGINGFIGHHLCRRILQTTDWLVYGMDLHDHRLRELLLDEPHQSRLSFLRGDIISNMDWIDRHIQRCDIIVP